MRRAIVAHPPGWTKRLRATTRRATRGCGVCVELIMTRLHAWIDYIKVYLARLDLARIYVVYTRICIVAIKSLSWG